MATESKVHAALQRRALFLAHVDVGNDVIPHSLSLVFVGP